jgi:hypothetical protein
MMKMTHHQLIAFCRKPRSARLRLAQAARSRSAAAAILSEMMHYHL